VRNATTSHLEVTISRSDSLIVACRRQPASPYPTDDRQQESEPKATYIQLFVTIESAFSQKISVSAQKHNFFRPAPLPRIAARLFDRL
jgi:hypothetical protein